MRVTSNFFLCLRTYFAKKCFHYSNLKFPVQLHWKCSARRLISLATPFRCLLSKRPTFQSFLSLFEHPMTPRKRRLSHHRETLPPPQSDTLSTGSSSPRTRVLSAQRSEAHSSGQASVLKASPAGSLFRCLTHLRSSNVSFIFFLGSPGSSPLQIVLFLSHFWSLRRTTSAKHFECVASSDILPARSGLCVMLHLVAEKS